MEIYWNNIFILEDIIDLVGQIFGVIVIFYEQY